MLNFFEFYSGIELLLVLVAYVIAVLCAIIPHELAHGIMAERCGDDTARLSGRLSLNPINHLDLMGTICLLLFGFGWAKPVPININNFKERKKGLFLVSIAGVVTNLTIAFFAVLLNIGLLYLSGIIDPTNMVVVYLFFFLNYLFQFIAVINISLMIFNLFPIYPLDGFNIVLSLTSYSNRFVDHMKRYSLIYSVGLILLCHYFLGDAVNWVYGKFVYFWLLAL